MAVGGTYPEGETDGKLLPLILLHVLVRYTETASCKAKPGLSSTPCNCLLITSVGKDVTPECIVFVQCNVVSFILTGQLAYLYS